MSNKQRNQGKSGVLCERCHGMKIVVGWFEGPCPACTSTYREQTARDYAASKWPFFATDALHQEHYSIAFEAYLAALERLSSQAPLQVSDEIVDRAVKAITEADVRDSKRDAIPSQQKLNEQAVLKRLVHHPSEVCGYIMAPPVGYRTYDCTLPRGHSGEHQSAIWA